MTKFARSFVNCQARAGAGGGPGSAGTVTAVG
jgi:hypothetical protein